MLEQVRDIIVTAAKEEILPRFNRVEHEFKEDGSLVTEADLAMQRRVCAALKEAYPHIAFLGEEMSEDEQQHMFDRHAESGLWCLDPLDGTSNFTAGIPYFSVSLAYILNRKIVMGIVYDPKRDELFSAEKGKGAHLNGRNLHPKTVTLPMKKCIGTIDYKRLKPDLAARLVKSAPFGSQRSFGSVALDWCWLAAGRGHLYLHGKQKLWDYAAGLLIHQESGGSACTLNGEEVFVGTMKPRSAVAALDKELFGKWANWLGIKTA